MSIFKACDIRGIYNKDLQKEHATALGRSIAEKQGKTDIVIGGDVRLSTPVLKEHLINGLLTGGCNVIDIGIISTPMFYYARKLLGIETGVMVTASHNPAEYNGFKIILGEMPVTQNEMDSLQELMSRSTSKQKPSGSLYQKEILDEYINFGKQFTQNISDISVVVDYGNGAGALAGPGLWESYHGDYYPIHKRIDGSFPDRSPNPAVAKNLKKLREVVLQRSADIGVAYDGDADRVAFIDDKGNFVSNDAIISLYIRDILKNRSGSIVYDQKCSRIVYEEILNSGGTPIMEKSGHTFIKTTFIKTGSLYAGELSGHHFFATLPQGDDAILASLFMTRIIMESGQNLSTLVNALPAYPITPDIRIPFSQEQGEKIIADLSNIFSSKANVSFIDGVRVEYPFGWGLIRQSVTEPLLTLRFEGKDKPSLIKIMKLFEDSSPDLAGKLLTQVD